MHPPPAPAGPHNAAEPDNGNNNVAPSRRDSMSQQSEDSQTAADFIRDQMQLEADAREALPYVRGPFMSSLPWRPLRPLALAWHRLGPVCVLRHH